MMYRESRRKDYDFYHPTTIEIQYNGIANIWHVLIHRSGSYYTRKYGALSQRQIIRFSHKLSVMGFKQYQTGHGLNGNNYGLWRKQS